MLTPNYFDDEFYDTYEKIVKVYHTIFKESKNISEYFLSSDSEMKKHLDNFSIYAIHIGCFVNNSLTWMFLDNDPVSSRGLIINFMDMFIHAIKDKKIILFEPLIDNIRNTWKSLEGHGNEKLGICISFLEVNTIVEQIRELDFTYMHQIIEYYGNELKNKEDVLYDWWMAFNYYICHFFIMDQQRCAVNDEVLLILLISIVKNIELMKLKFPVEILNDVDEWLKLLYGDKE